VYVIGVSSILFLFLIGRGPEGPHDFREALTEDFCSGCHDFHSAEGPTLLFTASKEGIQTRSPDEIPDSISLFCLACHSDGGSMKDLFEWQDLLGISLLDDHPIGVLYERETRGRSGYAISRGLPRDIPLREGKISCISCHEPHSRREGSMLRTSEEILCRSCHLINLSAFHSTLQCSSCHRMHTGWSEVLLISNTSFLCSSCHSFLSESHSGEGFSCETCHNPHSLQSRSRGMR